MKRVGRQGVTAATTDTAHPASILQIPRWDREDAL